MSKETPEEVQEILEKKDIELSEINMQQEEVQNVKWFSKQQIDKMIENEELTSQMIEDSKNISEEISKILESSSPKSK